MLAFLPMFVSFPRSWGLFVPVVIAVVIGVYYITFKLLVNLQEEEKRADKH
jgi:lipopolysaccharide export LptBFGC system permease protein LptF